MRYLVAAIVLITFPAIVAIIYGLLVGNFAMAGAAGASLILGELSFLVAGLVYRAMGRDPDAGSEH